MNYNINIRQEDFGATVMNLQNGKREYITTNELNNILKNGIFPEDSIVKNIKQKYKIKYTELKNKGEENNHFSFADIAYIEVTRACNLKCTHCLNNSGVNIENQLNKKQWLNVISSLGKQGIQEIRFTGGEPLVNKDIFEFINLASQLGIYTSIGTNGTLITEQVAKQLKGVGLNKAIISLDGTEKAHDKIRGEGNYKKTIQGIEELEKNKIEVRVNAVVMKENLEDMIIFAKKMHKNKTHLFIRRFIESGRGTLLKNNTLNKKDYDYFREKLSNEIKEDKYINGHYLRNDEGIQHRIKLPFNFIKGCKAGQRALVIMPDGDIHLCGFLAAQGFRSIGNIKNIENWKQYWDNIHKEDYLENLRNNLDKYNNIPNIQQTNCLAYVQKMLSDEE